MRGEDGTMSCRMMTNGQMDHGQMEHRQGGEGAQSQMCEMMHNGERMQGMMARGEDGTMSCRMMEQGQMGHGHMGHGQENNVDGAQGGAAEAQDHSSHEGHSSN